MKLLIELFLLLMLLAVFYTYLGYGLVIYLIVRLRNLMGKKRPVPNDSSFVPDVMLVVPAYNERDCIDEKVNNSLALDYPSDKLHILFVTEGSTDGTTELVEQYAATNPRVHVMGGRQRLGKIEAVNQAMHGIKAPFVIFTDANTTLNSASIKHIIRHFADPNVGAVAGEKRIQLLSSEAAVGSGEGLYWKYESFLKRLDTELYSVVGAAGELFAIRTELYEQVEKDTLLDDFVISLRIAERGYRVVYEPDAYALERPSFSVGDEKKRKVRIAAGGFQAISRLQPLLNIFRYGWLSFQYTSHRVMRWAIAPFCLPLILVLNALLLTLPGNGLFPDTVYQGLFVAQLGFYSAALLGYYLEDRQIRVKMLFVPYYFSFMNGCALLGYVRYRRGNDNGIWEKVRRAA
ncbi:glycosyltransferase family 2 protein [Spirosoma linguale]|uniref:Glycosyl transferase family 2 n=1 Tax=Spirosoma linguale (strain ATCC 33905 / DSM 74 / LMG 10896 / Claus 1) TaxID=504472 RepID=D2QHQ3_SPILD|nr:glycosyl transferase family 2 [Spirosoma linguale DSM 74]